MICLRIKYLYISKGYFYKANCETWQRNDRILVTILWTKRYYKQKLRSLDIIEQVIIVDWLPVPQKDNDAWKYCFYHFYKLLIKKLLKLFAGYYLLA